MKIPVPSTRFGLIFSLLTIGGTLFLYYSYAYSYLVKVYQTPNYESTARPIDSLAVRVLVPVFVSEFDERPILIRVDNTGDVTESNITITADFGKFEINDPTLYDNSQAFTNTLHIGDLEPKGVFLGQIPAIAGDSPIVFWLSKNKLPENSTDSIADEAIQIIERKPLVMDKVISVSRFAPIQAFAHAFIEKILLPPWSNALVPTVILFLMWIWEENILKCVVRPWTRRPASKGDLILNKPIAIPLIAMPINLILKIGARMIQYSLTTIAFGIVMGFSLLVVITFCFGLIALLGNPFQANASFFFSLVFLFVSVGLYIACDVSRLKKPKNQKGTIILSVDGVASGEIGVEYQRGHSLGVPKDDSPLSPLPEKPAPKV